MADKKAESPGLVIYKYEFPDPDHGTEQTFRIPRGAKILSIQSQRYHLQIWALVDRTKPEEDRTLVCYGTGRNIDRDSARLDHLATIQDETGLFVWHIFEVFTLI